MWPLERTQGFSKIWPSDLVFDLTWPIFDLVWDFIKTNILTKFQDYWTENVASGAYTRFSKIWPSDLLFDPTWPIFSNSSEISSRQTFWPSFRIIRLKMWPRERTQGCPKIWPNDLVLDSTWPIFELVRDFIKINILTKFHDNQTQNASTAYTRKNVDIAQCTTHVGHSTITIVHSEHFVLRWAKQWEQISKIINYQQSGRNTGRPYLV